MNAFGTFLSLIMQWALTLSSKNIGSFVKAPASYVGPFLFHLLNWSYYPLSSDILCTRWRIASLFHLSYYHIWGVDQRSIFGGMGERYDSGHFKSEIPEILEANFLLCWWHNCLNIGFQWSWRIALHKEWKIWPSCLCFLHHGLPLWKNCLVNSRITWRKGSW